jgi:ABC-type uncharacterized transport system auxiliary subunit
MRKPDSQIAVSGLSQWAERPRDTVVRALMDGLVASERFADVGYASAMSVPNYVLTGELRRFDLDRTEEAWRAVCQVRIEVRGLRGERLLWADTVTESEALVTNDMSALPSAMAVAVTRLVERSVESIAAVPPVQP